MPLGDTCQDDALGVERGNPEAGDNYPRQRWQRTLGREPMSGAP